MGVLERLVGRQVPRAWPVVDGDDDAGPVAVPSHAGGGLDVLGGRLGLADGAHEPEAADVDADGDHACGEQDVDRQAVTGRSYGFAVGAELGWAEAFAEL